MTIMITITIALMATSITPMGPDVHDADGAWGAGCEVCVGGSGWLAASPLKYFIFVCIHIVV